VGDQLLVMIMTKFYQNAVANQRFWWRLLEKKSLVANRGQCMWDIIASTPISDSVHLLNCMQLNFRRLLLLHVHSISQSFSFSCSSQNALNVVKFSSLLSRTTSAVAPTK
jgi:hypothetical protein